MPHVRSHQRRGATQLLLSALYDRQRGIHTIQIGFTRCAPQPYTHKKGCPARNTLNYCKYYKPSSVPLARPLSFIYDYGHPQPLATYPPTLGEQPLIVGIHGLATRKAYCQRTLLPLRWALTPPFHPYLPAEADIGGYSLLHYYTLTNVEPLTRAALCVARTFLSPLGQR